MWSALMLVSLVIFLIGKLDEGTIFNRNNIIIHNSKPASPLMNKGHKKPNLIIVLLYI